MIVYRWNWDVLFDNLDLLFSATAITIQLAVLSCLFGTLIAIPLTIGMRSTQRSLSLLSRIVMEVLRAVPLLVMLVWFFYVAPAIFPAVHFGAFVTAVIVFSLSLGGFAADVLRGAADSIPVGHFWVGESLGMSPLQLNRRILLPEVFRRAFPGLVALYIGLYKLTVLASVLGVRELLYTARRINTQTPAPFEVYTSLAVIFLITVIPLSMIARRLETSRWIAIYPQSNR